jgi:hypothetical protein
MEKLLSKGLGLTQWNSDLGWFKPTEQRAELTKVGDRFTAPSPPNRFATGVSSLTHGTAVRAPLSSTPVKEVDNQCFLLPHPIFSPS